MTGKKFFVKALAGCFVIAVIFACSPSAKAQETIVLQGNIKKKKLKANKTYVLVGGVFVTKKITIKPGTQILGTPGSFLCINRGAKIDARGTQEDPIIFTSTAAPGAKRRGDWGGLIINGRAPINVPGGTADGEGGTGQYGGTDPADDSGVLNFVRVEYGGFAISPDNELNCVAFQGVGNATDVDFVQAKFGGDDGFEWFGGTANARHLVSTGASDDSFDWTFGWSGKVQFAVIQQRANESDAGIEADNNENDFTFTPRSSPMLANFTIIGDSRTTGPESGPGSLRGVLLRRGTAGQLRNFIVMGFKNVGIEIRDQLTFDQLNGSTLTLRGMIFFNNGATLQPPTNFAGATATSLAARGEKILEIDPLLRTPFSLTAPDFRPQAASPALLAANIEAGFNDPFFTAANYVGAFDANTDWTLGWTAWVFGN